jgi:hypothetical protein
MQQHVMKTHLEDEVWLHVFLNSLKVVSGWSNSLFKVLRSEKQRPVKRSMVSFLGPKGGLHKR